MRVDHDFLDGVRVLMFEAAKRCIDDRHATLESRVMLHTSSGTVSMMSRGEIVHVIVSLQGVCSRVTFDDEADDQSVHLRAAEALRALDDDVPGAIASLCVRMEADGSHDSIRLDFGDSLMTAMERDMDGQMRPVGGGR